MSDQPACWSLADPALAWDVDVTADNSVFVSGIDSLKFPSRSPLASVAPEMIGDCDTSGAEEIIPCSPNTPILVEGVARGDSTTASNKVRLAVDWLDSTKALLSTSDVFNAAVTAANTWETKSGVVTAPASTAFYRVRFGKSNTAFNAWWDSVSSREFNHSFLAYLSSSASLSTGAQIPFNGERYDHGSWFDTSTHLATIPRPGIYSFTATAIAVDLDADEFLFVGIVSSSGDIFYGTMAVSPADDTNVVAQATCMASFLGGETIQVYWEHGHASAVNALGSSSHPITLFSGQRL